MELRTMKCNFLENHVNIATTGHYRLCCVSTESVGKETVDSHTPQQWLNSDTVTIAKNQLARNEWPNACRKCKEEEENGIDSRRLHRDHYGPGISHLDLRLGNGCNLKCISCNQYSSSSIAQEVIDMNSQGIIPLYTSTPAPLHNWYDERFFSYFENLPLKEIYLAGGEPMMVKHLPQFLERIDRRVRIRFSTNGTIYNTQISNLLKEFDSVIMTLSVDSIGKRAEYIRHGTEWKIVEENALRYSEFCKVEVSPTISILNATYYHEIVEWCSKYQFKIYENLLMLPEWLHIKNAPDSLKKQFTIADTWANQTADYYQQEQFVNNISKLDKFRNMYIKDYLPEVAEAYGLT